MKGISFMMVVLIILFSSCYKSNSNYNITNKTYQNIDKQNQKNIMNMNLKVLNGTIFPPHGSAVPLPSRSSCHLPSAWKSIAAATDASFDPGKLYTDERLKLLPVTRGQLRYLFGQLQGFRLNPLRRPAGQ